VPCNCVSYSVLKQTFLYGEAQILLPSYAVIVLWSPEKNICKGFFFFLVGLIFCEDFLMRPCLLRENLEDFRPIQHC
jgi:hypothetical protein